MKREKLHIAYGPVYAHSLPEGHRFPMLKYELIPAQLLYEGSITPDNLFTPRPCPDEVVLWTHDAAYIDKLKNQTLSPKEQRHIGFPQSLELTHREFVITQGTIDCCYYALENGVALNVAGGTHHAFADRGEGFCLINDFGVAANYLLRKNVVQKILIVDLDVHQGNGTAKLFEGEPRVFTFSVHGKNNYPFHKEKSDLDVPLPDGVQDAEYLAVVEGHLPKLLQEQKPDIVFYLSGVDILSTDKFGKFGVSMDGCRRRDEIVFTTIKKRCLPCVVAMGGGYSADVKVIVEAHCNTFRTAKDVWELD